jgi:formylglycine-generating enzyme required for sulfatase activity
LLVLVVVAVLAWLAKSMYVRMNRPVGPRFFTNTIGMEFRLILSGEFQMGASASDQDARDDEMPQHRVVLTKPFYLGLHEVTQEQYEQVVGRNPSYFSRHGNGKGRVAESSTAGFPVESVSWNHAVAFCRLLSDLPGEKAAGRVYRLPTEAEWEYACRAGSTTAWSFGESASELDDYAYFLNNAELRRPALIGIRSANKWGLYDMHGNVGEWCSDSFDIGYYDQSPKYNPQGPSPDGAGRIFRGGSWNNIAANCRSSCREHGPTDYRSELVGFRIVCDP